MTNEEILTKAIEQADFLNWKEITEIKISEDRHIFGLLEISYNDDRLYYSINDIIFSHDFAKAFFGEKELTIDFGPVNQVWKAWEWYLQLMVLEEDPIKFLEKFL